MKGNEILPISYRSDISIGHSFILLNNPLKIGSL